MSSGEFDIDGSDDGAATAPVWTAFGDLMSGLVGAFVLVLLGVLLSQLDLVSSLQAEVGRRQAEEHRRMALEKALAVPLASGRVTLANGRIGISGSVLFALNSDQLRPEGRQLLRSLVQPLRIYLGERGEMLMVSGFTDDKPIVGAKRRFDDNLELSAQRALTVTRALIEEGMPPGQVFAAAFGAEQPVAPNDSERGRTLNRRVEIAPVPRGASQAGPPAAAQGRAAAAAPGGMSAAAQGGSSPAAQAAVRSPQGATAPSPQAAAATAASTRSSAPLRP